MVPAAASVIIYAGFSFCQKVIEIYSPIKIQIRSLVLSGSEILHIFLGVLLISFTITNFEFYTAANIERFKHKALGLKIRETPELQKYRTLPIEDRTIELNVFSRPIEYYELSGIYRHYVGRDDTYLFPTSACRDDWKGFWLAHPQWKSLAERYNIKNYQFDPPIVKLAYSVAGGFGPRFWKWLWDDYFNEADFIENALPFIHVELTPIDNPDCMGKPEQYLPPI